MKQGIGEFIIDNVVLPLSLLIIGGCYAIRNAFRRFKL